ncbi:MAG TPA: TonB family protein [Bryobacteraceae bacterium]|jgi:TonB family protein|nr:TonB family protein [Bryobacteraceae bacterium]
MKLLALLTTALCLADNLANLSQARTAMNRGELVNAEQIINSAIQDAQAKFGSTTTALDPALDLLAQVYQREKRYADAASVEQQRVDIWTAAAGENSVVVGRALHQLSAAERQAGDLPSAESHSRRALAIMTAAYIDKPASAQAAVDLADILTAENRSDEAEQVLGLAEKTFETSLGADSMLTIGITQRRNALLKQLGRPISAPAPQATVFKAGGTVSQPRLLSKVEPQYAEDARKQKLQGTILLSLVVDATGTPTQIAVLRPLGMGLDEKAVEAISQWKFSPGLKNGTAVPVVSQVEMTFHLL